MAAKAVAIRSSSRLSPNPEGPHPDRSASGRPWCPDSLKLKSIQEQISELSASVICALHHLLDLKDLDTGIHSTRLAEWAVHVAMGFGFDEARLSDIEIAALLHDVGKVGIPDAILNKTTSLTAEESELMRKHPEYGWAVLRQIPGVERASLIILHHHERFDGQGYPGRLEGEEIPIGSRIVAVIDAFDAMVSARPYRKGLGFEEASRRLEEAAGSQFDPVVVRTFLPRAKADMAAVFAAAGDQSGAHSGCGAPNGA